MDSYAFAFFPASLLACLFLGIKWWQAKREIARLVGELTEDTFTPPLLNKRGFFLKGQRVYEREVRLRHEGRVGIACFDLVGFKRVNDEKGHKVGDNVLKLFARLLDAHFRVSDILAHLSGDEFAGIFPRMEEEVLHRKCSALVAEFERRTLEEFGIKVSARFCALSFCGSNIDTSLEGLLVLADEGMIAKRQGERR